MNTELYILSNLSFSFALLRILFLAARFDIAFFQLLSDSIDCLVFLAPLRLEHVQGIRPLGPLYSIEALKDELYKSEVPGTLCSPRERGKGGRRDMVNSWWPGRHLALVIVLFFGTSTRATDCFLPNGQIAYGDVPCSSDAVSTCCNGACLANGLCFNPSINLLSRSSCTDSTWTSSSCTTYCKTGKSLFSLPRLILTKQSIRRPSKQCSLAGQDSSVVRQLLMRVQIPVAVALRHSHFPPAT